MRLDEEDSGRHWDNFEPGVRIRWKTPTFVKRGEILEVKGRSIRVRFDGHTSDTVIPDAKWYWKQAQKGNMNEHLIPSTHRAPQTPAVPETEGVTDALTPSQAAQVLGTDPKNIRRMIRQGKLRAIRSGGRWVLERSEVEAQR